MKYRTIIRKGCLYFSCWCKKGYSVFSSLRREVKISRLAIHMYRSVLLKSSLKGLIIINTDQTVSVFLPLLDLVEGKELIGLAEGEVCPDKSNILINMERICCPGVAYPFFI